MTLLPTPDNYIGADKIFGSDEEEGSRAPYAGAIIPILNKEQEFYYPFKHKKELAGWLINIPPSLKEAIRYFILVTAISDLRFDIKEHRTMMVNVSRFTDVQIKTQELIEDYLSQIKSDIINYALLPLEASEQIVTIRDLHKTWNEFGLEQTSGVCWEVILKEYLIRSSRRIEVRSVNQKTGSKSLDYYNYADVGMRVIAVGGNSLSRGLTLEGLIVTYFYRNTMMYDTLLQMGRWFGYRPNYDDIFKLWLGEEAVDWYGYITNAVNELKADLRIMALQKASPEQFGLKVRQDPGYLIVTARNKMRTGTRVSVPISVSGRMIETPRLIYSPQILFKNNDLCFKAIENIEKQFGIRHEYDENVRAEIWRNVPREAILDLVREYKCHPWNLNFQPVALAEYIKNESTLEYWDVGIPFGKDKDTAHIFGLSINGKRLSIIAEERQLIKGNEVDQMLRVNGTHVRIGAGGCTKIGLDGGQIEYAKKELNTNGKVTDQTYLHKELKRRPIALIHIMHNSRSDETPDLPEYICGLGLGFPGGANEETATYVVNMKELENYIDINEAEDNDEFL